jgi:hypothetical protein
VLAQISFVRAGQDMIADCQNFPVSLEKYPAYSSGQIVPDSLPGGG